MKKYAVSDSFHIAERADCDNHALQRALYEKRQWNAHLQLCHVYCAFRVFYALFIRRRLRLCRGRGRAERRIVPVRIYAAEMEYFPKWRDSAVHVPAAGRDHPDDSIYRGVWRKAKCV